MGSVHEPRTILLTGASDGIGAAAARRLVAAGHRVVLVGRSPSKTRALATDLGTPFHVADFAELAQVRALAEAVRAEHPRIDVLANNAGGIWGRRMLTTDGYEMTFQVNQLAPFLLTHLLLPTLIDSSAAVVQTASRVTRRAGPTATASSPTSCSSASCTGGITTEVSRPSPSTPGRWRPISGRTPAGPSMPCITARCVGWCSRVPTGAARRSRGWPPASRRRPGSRVGTTRRTGSRRPIARQTTPTSLVVSGIVAPPWRGFPNERAGRPWQLDRGLARPASPA